MSFSRRWTTIALVTLAVLVAPHANAAPGRAAKAREPIVALIDTGVRATHQEFDYRGPSSTTDQFVAWWDFTAEAKPAITLPKLGQLWDTQVRDPFDKNGHGTVTASMAAGRNVDPKKTPSAYPAGKLAIAKVGTKDGSLTGSIVSAIRWATDTVRADVINISIGTIVPVPAELSRAEYDAVAYARARGVLVVVANGNGWSNAGLLPGDPGWANGFSSSPDVLSVGATGTDAYLVSTDPEVVATYTVQAPSIKDDTSYGSDSGTSFGSPFVAGFAARVIGAARAAGRATTPDRIEQLIKYTAADTSTPPQFEGYGVISVAQLAAATAHARAGTLPTRPSPDLSGTYVEQVAGTLRTVWTG